MYRKGHYGVALLVYAPVGFTLLTLGRPTLAFAGGAVMLWLAMLPDVDHRVPGLTHRGATHTLAFAALVGAAFGGVGFAAGSAVGPARAAELGSFGVAIGALTVLAHLLGDFLTPAGVALFWPLSGRRFSASITTADSAFWNYGLLATGVLVTSTLVLLAAQAGVVVLPS